MADEDVKIVIKQKGTIPVYTKTKVGAAEVYHDKSLEGKGTVGDPLKVSEKIIVDIDSRVEKTDEADKIYGTDSQGNQTIYDKDSFGQVDDVLVNGTSVVTDKIAEVEVPTAVSQLTNDADYQNGTQVNNTVSGAINTHNTSNNAHSNLLGPITEDISDIQDLIPSEASPTNQLADKDYVDSQIGDLNEWTTEQYTATTTNFVVGNTYTVEEAFQRTASLFEGQQDEIDDIEALIPTQATAQNQLADKSFVNATIATNSANFRGNWATWTNVPTQADLYPEDYVGNKTPTNNDYMVVDDVSDYVSPTGLSHEISAVNLYPTKDIKIRITDEYGTSSEYYYNDGFLNTWKAISEYYSLFYVASSPGRWYIKTNEPTETNIVINGTVYPVNPSGTTSSAGALLCTTNYSTDPVSAGIPASAGQYQGSWRFIYIGTWATDGKYGWNPVYRIGTAFTQEQQAAIDSGITANMVDNYVDPNSQANTAYNKRITALETDKRDIINSANKVYATDANGANKNDLVYSTSATANTIAQRGTNGVLKVGTPVDNADATTKQYVDTGLNAKQDTLTAGQNITITNNVISATGGGAVYNAGEGILINSNNDIMTNNIIWRYW